MSLHPSLSLKFRKFSSLENDSCHKLPGSSKTWSIPHLFHLPGITNSSFDQFLCNQPKWNPTKARGREDSAILSRVRTGDGGEEERELVQAGGACRRRLQHLGMRRRKTERPRGREKSQKHRVSCILRSDGPLEGEKSKRTLHPLSSWNPGGDWILFSRDDRQEIFLRLQNS